METEQQIAAKTLGAPGTDPRGTKRGASVTQHFAVFQPLTPLKCAAYPPNQAKTEKVKTRNEVNLTQENYLAAPTPPGVECS